jgi:solute carrier family 13 (sodium-dependent dicarboxylate transporter), member 2/3/5
MDSGLGIDMGWTAVRPHAMQPRDSGEEALRCVEARFEQRRRMAGWVLGPAVFALLLMLPMPGLTPEAHRLAAILGLTLVLWICESIPLAVTALLAPVLCVVLGVGKDKEVFAPFGSPIVFLFIGMFFVAAAMQKHGFEKRLALGMLGIGGLASTPLRLYASIATVTAVLSMWMSNVATTAVMLPIALGIANTCPDLARNAVARARLVLLIPFAASVGGLATPVGTPPNLIALGFLRELAGVGIGFLGWMQLAVPLSAVLVVLLVFLLRPPLRRWTGESLSASLGDLAAQRSALGRLTPGERNCALCLGGAIALWLYPGVIELVFGKPRFGAAWVQAHFPEEIVGLIAGLALFLLPTNVRSGEFTITWREAVNIDWGTILLFAGGLALGKQVFDTGLAKALGDTVASSLGAGAGVWALSAVAILLTLLLSTATSNTATANVMVPMMIAVAQSSGINPVPVALACCLASSFGFALPVSTGPNAMAYSTGEVKLLQMVRYGLILDIAGAVLIWLTIRTLAPLFGWDVG